MIISKEYHGDVEGASLQEYSTPRGATFRLAAEQAFTDNPATRLVEWLRAREATGQVLSHEEATTRAKERGVSLEHIPHGGIREDALKLLVDRQYRRKSLEERLSRSSVGWPTKFAGGMAGSLGDPLFLAASLMPGIGYGRYLSMLERASGPVSRTLIRGAYGGAQGAAVTAAFEPINYVLGRKLGDDYEAVDSLINVTMGTILGGGLHAGLGGISDAIRAGLDWRVTRAKGRAAEHAAALRTEARREAVRAAVGRALQDQTIDVDSVLLSAGETRAPAPGRPGSGLDPRSLRAARGKLEAEHTIRPGAIDQPDPYSVLDDLLHGRSGSAPLSPEANARFQIHGMEAGDPDAGLIQLLERGIDPERTLHAGPPRPLVEGGGSLSTRLRSPYLLLSDPDVPLSETGVRNVILNGPGAANVDELRRAFPGVNFLTPEEAVAFMERGESIRPPTADPGDLGGLPRSSEANRIGIEDALDAGDRAGIPLSREAAERATRSPNSRFLDDRQPGEGLQSGRPALREPLDEATEAAELAVAELRSSIDETVTKVDDILREVDDEIRTADEYARGLEAAVLCMTRRGI